MTSHEMAAMVGTGVLGALAVFQILLAAGLPLGRAAWGGRHRVLPRNLRLGSLAAVGILALAAWMLLARAGLVAPGGGSLVVRIVTWVFAGYFGLNVAMNLASKSRMERAVMTPVAAIVAACFAIVALS